MADIIKTWPSAVDARTAYSIFREDRFVDFYFTLGRGKPSQPIERLWFTYAGRIMGFFPVDRIVVNDGTLPRLHRLDGGKSEWQIKPDRWVAICGEPCTPLRERLFMSAFRGWRYFNVDTYRQTVESRLRI